MYDMSRDTTSHRLTSSDSAELRNDSTTERTLGHQTDQAPHAAVDLRNLHFPNPTPLSSVDERQVASTAHTVPVGPQIGRELFAAAWLAELHRLYYGGFVPAAAASVMTSPFPLLPPSSFLLSLASRHRMLMQQPLHGSVAPPDTGLRRGEHNTQEGLSGRFPSETRSPTTDSLNITASVEPELDAVNRGQKRVASNRNGNETKRLIVDVATRRNSTGLNDFSIPSILGGKGRFGGRRREDSGSVGSCGGATSGADSEDAWSTGTRSPEALSKLSSSDSDVFDEDHHDLRCPSAVRRSGFQTAVVNSSAVQPELYCFRQPIAGSCPTPLTVHSFPPTSPMSSASSSLSTSPSIYLREALPSRASSVASVEQNKRWRWKQEPLADASTTSEVDRQRGTEGRVLSRQTMVADSSSSSSSSRHFECPQCEKVSEVLKSRTNI